MVLCQEEKLSEPAQIPEPPLQQLRASFYCRTFTRDDARIERVLTAVEAVVQQPLNHYLHRAGKPKSIPGTRTDFVSQWLPGIHERLGSQLFCPEITSDHVLLVSLDNILTLPELIGQPGEPFNGALNLTFSADAPFAPRIIAHFAQLIAATDCFHAFLELSPQHRHQDLTHQNLVTPDGKPFALQLHWLNYWNDAAAERLRFPDENLDRPLTGLYERLPHGWLVKLTPQPTDLNNPANHEHRQWAHERFAPPLEQARPAAT